MLGISHTITASISLILGAFILFDIKGSKRHKTIGLIYFYCMLITNITALFIYKTLGTWFFPHTLAVATLTVLILGYTIIRLKKIRYWLQCHIVCLVLSYYMLIGGAINEAFIRIPMLKSYFYSKSPIIGVIHTTTMLFFIILIIYYIIKYRKLKVRSNNISNNNDIHLSS